MTRKRVYLSLSAKILAALKDVPRATVPKIAEDTGKERTAIYRHLRGLLEAELVEEAGRLDYGRQAMTYRIHQSMRQG